MFVCRLEDKDLPALGGPAEKVCGRGGGAARRDPQVSVGQTGPARGSWAWPGSDRGLPALPQASPAAADEDSCSSSAALSPSSSPRSMASGSGCAPGKCVCSSCGLEIVDKYLLKVRMPDPEPPSSSDFPHH